MTLVATPSHDYQYREGKPVKVRHVGLIKHKAHQDIAEHQNLAELEHAILSSGRTVAVFPWQELAEIGNRTWPQYLGPRPDLLVEITTWGKPLRVAPTLALIWRPIEVWTEDFLRYEYYATASATAYAHLRATHRSDLPQEPLILDHTVDALPGIKFEGRIPRLFYIGTNWERTVLHSGRAHGLLKTLDAKGLLDIFGPSVSPHGFKVWDDFSGYQGPLEFLAGAVPRAASQYKGVLALTTSAHAMSEICTSRAFEGASAGCVVVAPDLPEFRRVLGDSGCYFDPAALHAHFRRDRDLLEGICGDIQQGLLSDKWEEIARTSHERFVARFQLTAQVGELLCRLERQVSAVSPLSDLSSLAFLGQDESQTRCGSSLMGSRTGVFRVWKWISPMRLISALGLRFPSLRRLAFRAIARFHN